MVWVDELAPTLASFTMVPLIEDTIVFVVELFPAPTKPSSMILGLATWNGH